MIDTQAKAKMRAAVAAQTANQTTVFKNPEGMAAIVNEAVTRFYNAAQALQLVTKDFSRSVDALSPGLASIVTRQLNQIELAVFALSTSGHGAVLDIMNLMHPKTTAYLEKTYAYFNTVVENDADYQRLREQAQQEVGAGAAPQTVQ